ncbi:hypothetical protein Tco_1334612 [Tanacetum coccineum]
MKTLGIVDWFDPPMCHRAVSIILGLLRARNRQDAQLLEAQRGRQRMKKLLVLSWELYEEEQWGLFCRATCFQISNRMRHRDVVIGNILSQENHQIARRVVSYLREMHDHDMGRL